MAPYVCSAGSCKQPRPIRKPISTKGSHRYKKKRSLLEWFQLGEGGSEDRQFQLKTGELNFSIFQKGGRGRGLKFSHNLVSISNFWGEGGGGKASWNDSYFDRVFPIDGFPKKFA